MEQWQNHNEEQCRVLRWVESVRKMPLLKLMKIKTLKKVISNIEEKFLKCVNSESKHFEYLK